MRRVCWKEGFLRFLRPRFTSPIQGMSLTAVSSACKMVTKSPSTTRTSTTKSLSTTTTRTLTTSSKRTSSSAVTIKTTSKTSLLSTSLRSSTTTTMSVRASTSLAASASPAQTLYPIQDSSVDRHSIKNLLPSRNISLEYAELKEGGLATSLIFDMLDKAVALENSAYILDLECTDKTLTFRVSSQAAIEAVASWPQKVTLITKDGKHCQSSTERGVYVAKPRSVLQKRDASYLFDIDKKGWSDVAESMKVLFGSNRNGDAQDFTSSSMLSYDHSTTMESLTTSTFSLVLVSTTTSTSSTPEGLTTTSSVSSISVTPMPNNPSTSSTTSTALTTPTMGATSVVETTAQATSTLTTSTSTMSTPTTSSPTTSTQITSSQTTSTQTTTTQTTTTQTSSTQPTTTQTTTSTTTTTTTTLYTIPTGPVPSLYNDLSPAAKEVANFLLNYTKKNADGDIIIPALNPTVITFPNTRMSTNDPDALAHAEAAFAAAGLDTPSAMAAAASQAMDSQLAETCPYPMTKKGLTRKRARSASIFRRQECPTRHTLVRRDGDSNGWDGAQEVACSDLMTGFLGELNDGLGALAEGACAGKDLYDNKAAIKCVTFGCAPEPQPPPTWIYNFNWSWNWWAGFDPNTDVVSYNDGSKLTCLDCLYNITEFRVKGKHFRRQLFTAR